MIQNHEALVARRDVLLPRLGIDIGRVIIGGEARQSEQTLFGNDYLNAPEILGAIGSITALSRSGNWGNISLVSKCTSPVEARTLEWLDAHKFYDRTGIGLDDVYFCREIRDKVPIAERLKLTHFIDDRIAVLNQLYGIVPKRYLFGQQKSTHQQTGITPVRNWSEAMEELGNPKENFKINKNNIT